MKQKSKVSKVCICCMKTSDAATRIQPRGGGTNGVGVACNKKKQPVSKGSQMNDQQKWVGKKTSRILWQSAGFLDRHVFFCETNHLHIPAHANWPVQFDYGRTYAIAYMEKGKMFEHFTRLGYLPKNMCSFCLIHVQDKTTIIQCFHIHISSFKFFR